MHKLHTFIIYNNLRNKNLEYHQPVDISSNEVEVFMLTIKMHYLNCKCNEDLDKHDSNPSSRNHLPSLIIIYS